MKVLMSRFGNTLQVRPLRSPSRTRRTGAGEGGGLGHRPRCQARERHLLRNSLGIAKQPRRFTFFPDSENLHPVSSKSSEVWVIGLGIHLASSDSRSKLNP